MPVSATTAEPSCRRPPIAAPSPRSADLTQSKSDQRWFWPAFVILATIALVSGTVALMLYLGKSPVSDARDWLAARKDDVSEVASGLSPSVDVFGSTPAPVAITVAAKTPTPGFSAQLPVATFETDEMSTAASTGEIETEHTAAASELSLTALPSATHTTLPTAPPSATPTVRPTKTFTPAPTATATPTPRPPRRVAYVSEATGDPQIWLVDADGANRRQLTSQAGNLGPAWSADNSYLYYISNRDGQPGIYRQELATGAEEAVVTGQAIVGPLEEAGGQLAYVRQGGAGFELVWGERPIYSLDRRFDFHWSEARREFLIDPLADPRVLYVVNPQDGAVREVAGAKSWNGSWASDGRIIYTSDRLGTAFVFVAAPDGADARTIVPTDKWSQSPSWSPDGRWIGYVAGDGPAWNLYRVAADGSGRRRVGQAINPNESPIWEPSGQRMAYETTRRGNRDIATVDLQGRETLLAASSADDYSPTWSN